MEKDKMAKVEMSFSFINGSVFNDHPRIATQTTKLTNILREKR